MRARLWATSGVLIVLGGLTAIGLTVDEPVPVVPVSVPAHVRVDENSPEWLPEIFPGGLTRTEFACATALVQLSTQGVYPPELMAGCRTLSEERMGAVNAYVDSLLALLPTPSAVPEHEASGGVVRRS